MSATTWLFRPGKLPLAMTLLLVPALAALGFWQLDRARQKEALHDQYQQMENLPAVDLNNTTPGGLEKLLWRRASVYGRYVPGHNVFLDNQVLNGTPGYHVFTPFRISASGGYILVNRGWISAGAYRDRLPEIPMPAGELRILGKLREPAYTGLLLSDDVVEQFPDGIVRVQSIQPMALGKVLGLDLQPYVIRLEPESDSGFGREWPQNGSGSERNRGYAFQWFTMAAAVVIIFLFYSVRRVEPG